jgi:hypothetical protein
VNESIVLPPDSRDHIMSYYRAYIVGDDGHFINAIDLECATDTTAVESARQFVDGHEVEVWQEDRLVAVLPCVPATLAS